MSSTPPQRDDRWSGNPSVKTTTSGSGGRPACLVLALVLGLAVIGIRILYRVGNPLASDPPPSVQEAEAVIPESPESEPPATAEATVPAAESASPPPQPAKAAPGPTQVGDDFEQPEPIHSPPPRYTEMARRAKIEGEVHLRVSIDQEGKVEDVEILQGLPMGLDRQAVEAVRGWTFRPATRNGEPVAAQHEVTVEFRLE